MWPFSLSIAHQLRNMKEAIMSKLDELNTKVDTLTTGVTTIGDNTAALAKAVIDETAAINAALAKLPNADDPAVQAIIDRVSGLNDTVTTQAQAIADATASIKAETAALSAEPAQGA